MRTDNLPFIDETASFTELVLRMSEGRLGMVIVGTAEHVKGIVTDGDLRRALLKSSNLTNMHITEIMTANPVIIDADEYINEAEQVMMERKITTLLVGSIKQRSVSGVYQIYNT